MTKNSVHCTPYLRNYRSFDCHLSCTCIKWYLQGFFHFFKIIIFRFVSGVKGQKIDRNDKKLCPSCSIFQEPYIIWLSFMVHMCKIIISPGVFSFFQKFDLSGVKGKKKKTLIWQKIMSITLHISKTIHNMIVMYDTHVQSDNISRIFFIFTEFLFSGSLGR